MLPGIFFPCLNWMVPGSLAIAVSKPGSNHCLFEAVCWQPKRQQAQPPRSSQLLVTFQWPLTGKLEREGDDFQGKQLIHHLYKHAPNWPLDMSVLGEWLWETGGIGNMGSQDATPCTHQPHKRLRYLSETTSITKLLRSKPFCWIESAPTAG